MISILIEDKTLSLLFSDIEKAGEVEEILDEAAAAILNRIRTRFLNEQDPDGVPWLPSKAGLKRRSKGGTGTLFDTGTLFRSIQLSSERPKGERHIKTDVRYAAVHNYGGGNLFGGGSLPPRPFMGFSKSDEDLFKRIIDARLKRALARWQ